MFSREREREVRASPSESYCIILLSVQMGGREAAGRRPGSGLAQPPAECAYPEAPKHAEGGMLRL